MIDWASISFGYEHDWTGRFNQWCWCHGWNCIRVGRRLMSKIGRLRWRDKGKRSKNRPGKINSSKTWFIELMGGGVAIDCWAPIDFLAFAISGDHGSDSVSWQLTTGPSDFEVIEMSPLIVNKFHSTWIENNYEQVGCSAATGAKSSWCCTKTARWPGSRTRAARSRKDVCCCAMPRNWWPSVNTPCECPIDRPVYPTDAPWSSLWLSARPIVRKSTGSSPNPRTRSSTFSLFTILFQLEPTCNLQLSTCNPRSQLTNFHHLTSLS